MDKPVKRNRKRRNDRNHVVYKITCTVTGETYIGITAAIGRAYKRSIAKRWKGHVSHALVEKRTGLLQIAIREHGPDAFTHELLEIVRGKKAVHARERELIHQLNPELNVECTDRKQKRVPADDRTI